jgi:hypothetical protein
MKNTGALGQDFGAERYFFTPLFCSKRQSLVLLCPKPKK